MITQSYLQKIINYNPETGIFTWLQLTGKARPGREAGYLVSMSSRKENKYRLIGIDGKNYLAHRLAFLYMTGSFPKNVVDHINHNCSDNRWINLRAVSSTDNNRNVHRHYDNKSGICGVWLDKKIWVAKIGIKSKQVCLGRFDNIFDAACARKQAEIDHGYHKNHGLA